jgi:hypothetical protein
MTHEKLTRWAVLAAVALAFVSSASASWKEKVLYSFQGIPDGATPAGGVVFDSEGNLYGATTEGGADNCPGIAQCGTVFQLTPPAQKDGVWTETILYVFKGKTVNDGSTPAGGVILDKAGNIYGTTGYGGSGDCVLLGGNVGCGTVWELSPPKEKGGKWTEQILYSFKKVDNGWLPQGDLTFDGAGNLYGATEFGGGKGTTCDSLYTGQCGTVFELSPPMKNGGKWTETVLHNFAGIASGKNDGDGANPNGGLIFGTGEVIYGSTGSGGSDGGHCPNSDGFVGCGTVFRLSLTENGAWSETILHRFRGRPGDGSNPNGNLVLDSKGDPYGATVGGGADEEGTAFYLSETGGRWQEDTLLNFLDGNNGAVPMGGLVFVSAGHLLGTNSIGGGIGGGEVYELIKSIGGDNWSYVTLYEFEGKPDGSYPTGELAPDASGNVFGTTQQSGTGQRCGNTGCGTVFETWSPE